MMVLAGLLAMLSGCGPTKQAPPALVFYPPPPDAPRIQYLVTINDAEDWQEHKSSFADFIVGAPKNEDRASEIRNPFGVAARDGRLYVCDLGRFKVHVIDVVNKRYSALGTAGQVAKPVGITIDADGTKYVADAGKQQVIVFDAQDRFVRALGDPKQCGPMAVAIHGDELFVADALNGRIVVWSKDGTPRRTISSKCNGPDQLRRPAGLAISPQGLLYVADMELSVVKVFDLAGRYVRSIGGPGDRPGYFARPKGIAIDKEGRIYVADAQWDKIQIYTPEGQLLLYFGETTRLPHGLVTPTGLAIDATSLDAFRKYVNPDFEPEFLLVVTNEFGVNKVSIHAFGHARPREAAATPVTPAGPAATQVR
jgi:DNA-binding beta-propeller fold protein YncE